MISLKTSARLYMTITYMAQEAGFGLTILFPSYLQHLVDKPMDQLTEDEAELLIEAGMKAHREALFSEV